MESTFIKYQRLGKDLSDSFDIYSDKGLASPSGVSRQQLLSGVFVNFAETAQKVFIIPKIYDLSAEGNINSNISGLKFNKTDLIFNSSPIYYDQTLQYAISRLGVLNRWLLSTTGEINGTGLNTGSVNFGFLSELSGSGLNIVPTGNYYSTRNVLFNAEFVQKIVGDGIEDWGNSVAINGSGNVVLFGGKDNLGNGAAIIYTLNNFGNWIYAQKLTGDAGGDNWGASLTVNNDGSIIVLGGDLDNQINGAAIIYTGSTGLGWTYKQKLTGDVGQDRWGHSMAISDSGNVIILGGRSDNIDSGAAIIYTGNATAGWTFKQKLTGDTGQDNWGWSVATNNNGSVVVLGGYKDNNNSGAAIVYTGNATSGWAYKQKLTGDAGTGYYGWSTATNGEGNVIVFGGWGNNNNSGAAIVYTGNAAAGWTYKQKLTGDGGQDRWGHSVSTNNDGSLIVLGGWHDNNQSGAAVVYTGNAVSGWGYRQKLTGDSGVDNWGYSTATNDYGNTIVIGGPADNNRSGGAIIFNTPNNPINISSSFVNKLHVYNIPGITGFAGTYTSGTFTVGGIPRVGFRNSQNQNFYIYKNNSPSAWRAVEDLYNGPFTWYSVTGIQGVDLDPFPPVIGWRLGDDSVMSPQPVTDAALPLPEMNFGRCPANALAYPSYIYEAINTQDSNLENIQAGPSAAPQFYSGGLLSSSGTSQLFSGTLSQMFPDLYNVYFDKQFYYTNIVTGTRLVLFRVFDAGAISNFYITKSPQDYNSGYFYWKGVPQNNQNIEPDNFKSASKKYDPVGNNIEGLQPLFLNLNPDYLYKGFGIDSNITINTLNSGDSVYISTQDDFSEIDIGINNIYKYMVVNSIPQSTDTMFSKEVSGAFTGNNNVTNLFNINPTSGNIVDVVIKKPIIISVSGNWRNTSAEWLSSQDKVFWENFTLTGSSGNRIDSSALGSGLYIYSGFAPYQYLKIQKFTGSGTSGTLNLSLNYSTPDPLQNTGLFHCFSGENYIFANPRFNVSRAKCPSHTGSIWSILDSEYNYTDVKNCETGSGILPLKEWFKENTPIEYSNFKFTNLYSHNILEFNLKGLISSNSGYNYSKISGLFNLNTGASFVFDFEDNTNLTGYFKYKAGDYGYYGSLYNTGSYSNYYGFNSGIIRNLYVNDQIQQVTYLISSSGSVTKLQKYLYLSPTQCNFGER